MFSQMNDDSTQGPKLFGFEAIQMSVPEGETFSRLRLHETFWIFTLYKLSPDGLNEELEMNTLL